MDPDDGSSSPSPPRWPAWLEPVRGSPGALAALAIAGVAIVAVGAFLVSRGSEPVVPIEARMPSADAVELPPVTSGDVLVHVAGAVVTPGLYRVRAGARVADVIEAAGGFAPDARPDAVNLAEPVVDGSQVYVPGPDDPSAPIIGDGGAAASSDARVDINRATAAQLESLPGIGPTRAGAIVEHREAHGPFASVDALADVPGIGQATIEGLRDAART
jgi:competence protein ComEA